MAKCVSRGLSSKAKCVSRDLGFHIQPIDNKTPSPTTSHFPPLRGRATTPAAAPPLTQSQIEPKTPLVRRPHRCGCGNRYLDLRRRDTELLQCTPLRLMRFQTCMSAACDLGAVQARALTICTNLRSYLLHDPILECRVRPLPARTQSTTRLTRLVTHRHRNRLS